MKASFPVLALAALLLCASAGAHQQKAAVTRVLFNERTGNIEVMHRFILHDAEHAVRQLFGVKADILGSVDTRQQFADYVAARFELRHDDHTLPLVLVGSEIDGQFLWVYQETPIPEKAASLSVRHDALRDLWPSQQNLVNIEREGTIRSLRFRNGTVFQTAKLSAPGD